MFSYCGIPPKKTEIKRVDKDGDRSFYIIRTWDLWDKGEIIGEVIETFPRVDLNTREILPLENQTISELQTIFYRNCLPEWRKKFLKFNWGDGIFEISFNYKKGGLNEIRWQ